MLTWNFKSTGVNRFIGHLNSSVGNSFDSRDIFPLYFYILTLGVLCSFPFSSIDLYGFVQVLCSLNYLSCFWFRWFFSSTWCSFFVLLWFFVNRVFRSLPYYKKFN
jgi:hypothetical protein